VWSPEGGEPMLATGTVAGALDESFSNESALEIWAPAFGDRNEYALGQEGGAGPIGVVTGTSRCARCSPCHTGGVVFNFCAKD
jgi:protein transport protein SEC31